MQKKNMGIWSIIVVLFVIGVGGYLIFHKSPKPATTSTKQSTTSSKTAINKGIIQTKTVSGIGLYLADSSDNSLYTYSGDTQGVSNCTGSCISSWPPYSPTTSSVTLPTNVTIITRSDGSKQYAYKGLPLYTFTGDSSGQLNGNGVSGFSVAKP